jgi:Mg-chelatase subunit ChlD
MRKLHAERVFVCLILVAIFSCPQIYAQDMRYGGSPLQGQVDKQSTRLGRASSDDANLNGQNEEDALNGNASNNGYAQNPIPQQGIIDRNAFNSGAMTNGPLTGGAFDNPAGRSRSQLDLRDKPLLRQQLNILGQRDIYIVVDKSSSMHKHDCPGRLSRWHWCQYQAQSFSEQAASVLNKGVTLAFFDMGYEIYPGLNADGVAEKFADEHLGLFTHPENVLRDIFAHYFRSGSTRPISIAVITDGQPNDPMALAQVIAEATQYMKRPDQISITFLQVGYSRDGSEILTAYRNLGAIGARYNIVDSQSFDDLQRLGLIGSIVASVNRNVHPHDRVYGG